MAIVLTNQITTLCIVLPKTTVQNRAESKNFPYGHFQYGKGEKWLSEGIFFTEKKDVGVFINLSYYNLYIQNPKIFLLSLNIDNT